MALEDVQKLEEESDGHAEKEAPTKNQNILDVAATPSLNPKFNHQVLLPYRRHILQRNMKDMCNRKRICDGGTAVPKKRAAAKKFVLFVVLDTSGDSSD